MTKTRRVLLMLLGGVLLIACVVLLILAFCTNAFADLWQTRGNTSANLANRGIAAAADGWIYTVDGQKEYQGLYRVRSDGGKSEKLFEGICGGINVCGGCVYFLHYDQNTVLYKVKTGGGQPVRLKEGVSKFLVLGNWIYYQNDSGIHRMRTDGKKDTLLTSSYTLLDVQRGWIYCATTQAEAVSVCKMRIDGSERRVILSDVYRPMVEGDRIYFFSESKGYAHVEGAGLEGQDRKLLSGLKCSHFFAAGDTVFLDTLEGIFSVKSDGSGLTRICMDRFAYMNSAGGWLIYDNDIYSGMPGAGFTLYKMRTDGSQESRLWGDTCGIEDFEDSLMTQPATPSNSNNGGLVTRQGGYVFFSFENKLCRMLESTGEVMILSYESGSSLYVIGNYLYYQTGMFVQNLNRTPLEGFKASTVTTDETRWLTIIGNRMYYCNWGKDGYLYTAALDGKERKWICDDRKVWYLNVCGDQFYYCLNEEDAPGSIVRIGTDGKNRMMLLEGRYSNLIADNDWIYFCSEDEDGTVYRMKADGSQKTGLGISAYTLNLSGEWLYYADRTTKALCRVKKDGTHSSVINKTETGRILIVGNWVYCYSPDDSSLLRVSPDGTKSQQIKVKAQFSSK